MARFKVCYCFVSDFVKAKAALKRVPKIFSHPHLLKFSDGSFGVVAGEYDRKDWADSAVKKLYENKLYGGILSQSEVSKIVEEI